MKNFIAPHPSPDIALSVAHDGCLLSFSLEGDLKSSLWYSCSEKSVF